ncbi:MAG: HAD family hydrolase [Candidatus Methanodesulfokora sp.]|jgi:HAD superfamily hydrolase (TIGR01549 family)
MELVIFDLDGTLIDSHFDKVGARLSIVELLRERGVDPSPLRMEDPPQKYIDLARRENLLNEVKIILDEYEITAFSQSKPKDGLYDVLNFMRRRGLKIGLLTNAGKKATEYALTRFNLKSYFNAVVTRDDCYRMKPNPDGIILLISMIRCDKKRTAFVGDTALDVEAAKSAGVLSIALLDGVGKPSEIEVSKPDYTVGSIRDLINLPIFK